MKQRDAATDPDEDRAPQRGAPEPASKVPEPAESEKAELSGWKRFGYALLGIAIAAMGFWIFPYQLERGDLFKTLTGAALAIVGAIVVYRALSRSRLRSLEKLIELLSDLAG